MGHLVENPEAVQAFLRAELPGIVGRAVSAGAEGPLHYMGAGAFGAVLCDADARAWKVARFQKEPSPKHALFMGEQFSNEYEWLWAAGASPISGYVPAVYDFHPEEVVLERECVFGRPGGWADEARLFRIHKEIEEAMIPIGWTAPEFKGDSYIIEGSGVPKLVDISMVQRVGANLAGWIEEVLDRKRQTHENWHSLAFYLLREMREKTLSGEEACPLLFRLVEEDPAIAKGFSLPC